MLFGTHQVAILFRERDARTGHSIYGLNFEFRQIQSSRTSDILQITPNIKAEGMTIDFFSNIYTYIYFHMTGGSENN